MFIRNLKQTQAEEMRNGPAITSLLVIRASREASAGKEGIASATCGKLGDRKHGGSVE